MPTKQSRKYRKLFEDHLTDIEEALDYVSRGQRTLAEDNEDFRSWALLRLMEDDFKVFRLYEGRSGWRTYLATVIRNIARDYRVSKWGRYRPSRTARRLGAGAVALENLVRRDGYTLAEAERILLENHGTLLAEEDLEEIVPKLGHRTRPLHTSLSEGNFESLSGVPGVSYDQREEAQRVRQLLEEALDQLDEEDRRILKLRFFENSSIASISRALRLDQRRLYGRVRRLLTDLRAFLERAGVTSEVARRLFGQASLGFSVDLGDGGFSWTAPEVLQESSWLVWKGGRLLMGAPPRNDHDGRHPGCYQLQESPSGLGSIAS